MAGTHAVIDCIDTLQQEHLKMADMAGIKSITIDMSGLAFKKGGWATTEPLTSTGALMSAMYAAAVQLLDKQVLPTQFTEPQINRLAVAELMSKMICRHETAFDESKTTAWHQRVMVELTSGNTLEKLVLAPRGIKPPLSNEEVLTKWSMLTASIIEPDTRDAIENAVFNLEKTSNMQELMGLLGSPTTSPPGFSIDEK